jgi:hypothetical protein
MLGLFTYSKLLPHSGILNSKALRYFSFLDKLFNPLCSFISRTFSVKWEIGSNGMKLDFGQLILFAFLLIVYTYL